MKPHQNLKIINDPIYGFITIPSQFIFDLIETNYFQRLRRISQMGMTYLVFPGAHHTRFDHALGAMFLMQKAVQVLISKGVEISKEEEEALLIAILLHDIGHGPFSHAMENSIADGVSHEQISLLFMNYLNTQFNNRLTLAIAIFKNENPRKFLHQLVSGQLDMDRLDYLKRDSFYSGVSEGWVNSERIIAMLSVKDDQLVVEEKGIYSIEKFIIARRLMYWQVYLHKTGVGAEQLLLRLLKRAKFLSQTQTILPGNSPFLFFLKNRISIENFTDEILKYFATLDDYDIISAIKFWTNSPDFVLRTISEMILNRKLLKIKVRNQPFDSEIINKKITAFMKENNVSEEEASYFIFDGQMENQAYRMDKDTINLITRSGKIREVAEASDQLNLTALSKNVVKYYLCYPKTNY